MTAISAPAVPGTSGLSTLQLYLLRGTYALILAFLVTSIWPGVIHHDHLALMHGVARSLLAAMAPLMLMGLRYPLKMLPVLFFELAWKTIWLLFFALPLWTAHQVDPDTWETIKACALVWVIFPFTIPWRYVFETYVKAPGDRWSARTT
jgi:hypothetical protein